MSSVNVLPSAPPADIENQLYPNIPSDNFRLTEISKIEKEISAEVEHYRLVLKKYKKSPESGSLFSGWSWRCRCSCLLWLSLPLLLLLELLFSCLAPARSFPSADKSGCPPVLPPGTRFDIPRDL